MMDDTLNNNEFSPIWIAGNPFISVRTLSSLLGYKNPSTVFQLARLIEMETGERLVPGYKRMRNRCDVIIPIVAALRLVERSRAEKRRDVVAILKEMQREGE